MEFIPTIEAYERQISEKIQLTKSQFSGFTDVDLEVFRSSITAYRMRAEFKLWHENGEIHYAMHEPGVKNRPYIIETFPIASKAIQTLMPKLRDELNRQPVLKQKAFQVEFLSTTTDEMLVTLIYHRPLSADWLEAAKALAQKFNIHLIGRARKQKVIIGNDFVTEALEVHGRRYLYQQKEGAFTQPNASVSTQMLQWSVDCMADQPDDFLELYCGNGNFTLPLSQKFRKVLATEISKSSIQSALYNCQLNNINAIEFVRMSSEEFTQALNKERPFRRLATINLDDYHFSTLLVDPPRAGLDSGTRALASQFPTILYISCNPDTLARDLETLLQTHQMERMALFDQFPYTHHREMGVLLQQRP